MPGDILQIKNLTVNVPDGSAVKSIVDGISLNIPERGIVALVGGSGSGKTTTGLAILRLLAAGLSIPQGEIIFQGQNLLALDEGAMRKARGGSIGMVFQDPLNAFNPVFSIGYQVDEMMQFHTKLNKTQRRDKMKELFQLVGLPDPERVIRQYPHQLSGGMRQRAMIAQALAPGPALMIADEPTSSLDVTLQAKIMALFKKLRDELNLTVLLITHDLGMVSHMADYVAVMKAGCIVEHGVVDQIMHDPKDDYTRQLMAALT